MPFNIKYIIMLFFMMALFSCTIKKRIYRGGYYVSFNSHKGSNKTAIIKAEDIEHVSEPETALQASLDNSLSMDGIVTKREKSDSSRCGDTLILRSGTRYIVKIIELSSGEIKVKRCADKAGNVLSFRLEDVERAVDINGVVVTKQYKKKEIEQKKAEIGELKKAPEYKDKSAFASFVLIILLVSLLLVSITLALEGSIVVALPVLVAFLALLFRFKKIKLSFIKVMLHKKDPNSGAERSRLSAVFFAIGIALIFSAILFYDSAILFPLIGFFFVFELIALILSARTLFSKNANYGKELATTIFILSLLAVIGGLVLLALLSA